MRPPWACIAFSNALVAKMHHQAIMQLIPVILKSERKCLQKEAEMHNIDEMATAIITTLNCDDLS
jgi:hypothetical protein